MDHMTCEMCWKRAGRWYLLDKNMETTICGKCAAEIRKAKAMTIERIGV